MTDFILKAIADDPNVAADFAAILDAQWLSDDELMAAIDSAALRVSYYEAAEGEYSRETEPRTAARMKLRVLRAEAEMRGLGGKVDEMIRTGGYPVSP